MPCAIKKCAILVMLSVRAVPVSSVIMPNNHNIIIDFENIFFVVRLDIKINLRIFLLISLNNAHIFHVNDFTPYRVRSILQIQKYTSFRDLKKAL